MIYEISQTLACSRAAAVRIHSFSLFHININSGPAGFITSSHATNTLEVVFCQLFYIARRLLDIMDEVQAVMDLGVVAVDEMKRLNVTP